MTKSQATEKITKLYLDLLATQGLTVKGKNMPYTSMNGNMYSFVAKEGYVAIRLSEADKEIFIKKYDAKPAVSYGAIMKGYVQVPDDILKNTDELKEWMEKSHEFAKTLKSKPTKKK